MLYLLTAHVEIIAAAVVMVLVMILVVHETTNTPDARIYKTPPRWRG